MTCTSPLQRQILPPYRPHTCVQGAASFFRLSLTLTGQECVAGEKKKIMRPVSRQVVRVLRVRVSKSPYVFRPRFHCSALFPGPAASRADDDIRVALPRYCPVAHL